MPPGPWATVVMPSFNQAPFLRAAIESVLAQDYPKIQLLVMDAASTDGSVDILRSYGDRIAWRSERDRGQGDAINQGFRRAKGEIVSWLNSDDLLLPSAVAKAVAALESQPLAGMVYGDGWILDRDGRKSERFPHTEPFNLYRLIHFGDTILQQSAFFRKSAVEQVGWLDESLRWGLDWDLFIRLGKRYPVLFLPDELGAIRVHEEAKTSTGGWRRLAELGRIAKRHAGTRWTASFAGYALDTAYGVARAKFPNGFGRKAVDAVHQFAARRIFPAMEECSGWYSDGWASPSVRALFPWLPGARTVAITGELPLWAGEQRLTWKLGRQPFADAALPRGRFRIEQPLPAFAAGDLLALELRAARTIRRRPRYHGGEQRLAYRLREIAIEGEGPRLVCAPPRRILTPEDPPAVH